MNQLNNQETMEIEYRSERKKYEEREEELYRQKQKAINVIEEVQERSHFYLKQASQDNDVFKQAFHETEHLKDEVHILIKDELNELSREMEDLDNNYHQYLQRLKTK